MKAKLGDFAIANDPLGRAWVGVVVEVGMLFSRVRIDYDWPDHASLSFTRPVFRPRGYLNQSDAVIACEAIWKAKAKKYKKALDELIAADEELRQRFILSEIKRLEKHNREVNIYSKAYDRKEVE